MSWKRLATFALGGTMAVVGVLVPAAGPALVPAGVGLLGLATRAKWLDGPKKKPGEPAEPPAE